MTRRPAILALLALLALCATARGETRHEQFLRIHRERGATTRYGAPPRGDTNAVASADGGIVIAFAGYSSSNYSDSFGPISGSYTFSVPFTTAQGWTGYAIAGQSAPSDVGGVMSQEFVICDPGTGGSLVMLFHQGTEHGRFDTLDPATTPTYTPFGSTSGSMTVSRGSAPISVSSAVSMAPEDIRAWLAPPPGAGEVADGDLRVDCLAIPEGTWLVECPIEGSTNTAWRAALCPSNILEAVVWRHAVGLAPTNLPVTISHDASRTIGRIERLYYERGTGVVARLRVRSAGYAEAISNRCDNLSPDVRCFTTVTNVTLRSDCWRYEHQDYLDQYLVPRLQYAVAHGQPDLADDLAALAAVTNAPAAIEAVVMAPIFLRGISFVDIPMLPTRIEMVVPEPVTNAYPTRPPALWHW